MDKELERNLCQRLAIGDGFRRVASRMPNKTALIEKREEKNLRVSYRELNDQLNRFGRAMRELGLKKGDRVASLGLNSIEFIISLYGTPKGGFVFVPINIMLPPDDILFILNDSEANVLVFDNAFLPLVLKVMEARPKTVKHFIYMPIINEKMPEEKKLINFNEIVNRQSHEEIEDVIIWERDLAEISYTSGATAAPKPVMISHLNTVIPALQTLIEFKEDFCEDSIAIATLPVFHCGGRTFLTSLLYIGGTQVLMRMFDVVEFLEAVQREKVTMGGGLPMMWRAIMYHPDRNKYDLSSWKHGGYGMAPMDQELVEKIVNEMGIMPTISSGQTEFFPPTNYRKGKWALSKIGNFWGTPGLMVDGQIMDDDGNLLPPGEVGEIVWRGPACMEGYRNNPSATDESRKFGWHHSGDLGFIDEDGLLKFVDRKKDMVKSGGENVPTIKVEEAILGDTRVMSVAVIGLPHERWVEAVTAFIVPQEDTVLSEEEIITLCKNKLAGFEVPKKVVFVKEIPVTSTGKIRKNIIREQYKDLYKEQ